MGSLGESFFAVYSFWDAVRTKAGDLPSEREAFLLRKDLEADIINKVSGTSFKLYITIEEKWRRYVMCRERELSFSIYMLYSLADKWQKSPATVYKILNSTGILDDYIIACYDVLHTQGKEYLVEDITEYVKEKGVNV